MENPDHTHGQMPPMQQRSTMPGGRAALRAGTLSVPFFGPQGDENREPPPGSPTSVKPAPVVTSDIDDEKQQDPVTIESVSTRTTGSDPAEGADPGGTRPTKLKEKQTTAHSVTSGDRNMGQSSTVAPVNKPK